MNVIPDAAVEAAAIAVYGAECADLWVDEEPKVKASYLSDARLALEAAAPHMLADARFEAWEEGMSYALPGTQRGIETFDAMRKSNPYRNTK